MLWRFQNIQKHQKQIKTRKAVLKKLWGGHLIPGHSLEQNPTRSTHFCVCHAVVADFLSESHINVREFKYYDNLKIQKRFHEKIFPINIFFQHFRKWGEAKIEYPKGSNGEQVQKWKVFWLFFYDTPFKNCIFSMHALIARRSKYDFWIPDKILTLEIKIQIKKIFF